MQLSHVFKIIVKRYITLMDSGKTQWSNACLFCLM